MKLIQLHFTPEELSLIAKALACFVTLAPTDDVNRVATNIGGKLADKLLEFHKEGVN